MEQNKKNYWIWPLIIIIAIAGLILVNRKSSPAVNTPNMPNTPTSPTQSAPAETIISFADSLNNTPAPWPVDTNGLKYRLGVLGLPALSQEGTALHIHQHLDIFIDGKLVPVPAGIGVNEEQGFISPIHTHDNSGVIHVESPTIQTFTLGQFFDIWGVKFSQNCVGAYCSTGEKPTKLLKAFVNGTEYKGNFVELPLAAHEEIVITYGTDKELPNPIPESFGFQIGE